MRAFLERSRPARFALALTAIAAALPLVRASAMDEAAFRLESLRLMSLGSDLRPAIAPSDMAVAAPPPRRKARRIWAASRNRPLRTALGRRGRPTRVAERRRRVQARVAQNRPAPEPQVVFSKLIVLPKPSRPALVSIYQDGTLRDGDAVMMADGIHLFRATGEWPYRPRNFVRLNLVAALDWRLRRTLDVFDRNPPVRLSSAGPVAG